VLPKRDTGGGDERPDDQQHQRIREFLQRVIIAVLRRALSQTCIVRRHRQNTGGVARTEEQFPESSAYDTRHNVHDTGGQHSQAEVLMQRAYGHVKPLLAKVHLRPAEGESGK